MIFPIKVRAGQEELIADLLVNKAKELKLPIYSIVIPPSTLRGYILGEAENVESLINAAFQVQRETGFRLRVINKEISEEELKAWIEETPIEEFKEGDLVEIVSGSLKGEKGKIVKIMPQKKEAMIQITSHMLSLNINVPLDILRKVKDND